MADEGEDEDSNDTDADNDAAAAHGEGLTFVGDACNAAWFVKACCSCWRKSKDMAGWVEGNGSLQIQAVTAA